MLKCPGQDTRYWKPDDIFNLPCPVCDTAVEFLKTDSRRTCQNCGYTFRNPRLELGCAQWCAYAEECLGFGPEQALPDNEEGPLTEQLIAAMKGQFDNDYKRIAHALLVFEYARELLRAEGGDARVVIAAALLHDVGIKEAEHKYGGDYQERHEAEGAPIARRIMANIGLGETTIEQVCHIVANHHRSDEVDTLEFRIVWDADALVNLLETQTNGAGKRPAEIVEKIFKTRTGKKKAYELLAN